MSSTATIKRKSKSNKKDKKHLKLEETHRNNITISNKNLGNKYTNFEDSLLDKSRTLLYEVNSNPTNFKKFSRGQIVKVKFGVNVGSEFSGDHYAIVITKKDSTKSPILQVIPLTSKNKKYNISINESLYNEEKINKLKKQMKKNLSAKELRKIKRCINYYEKCKNKNNYACIKHLSVISKLNICKPINEFDYLSELKVSSDVLDLLDENIIREYTMFNDKNK